MIAFLKRQPPVRIIAMGFALVILLGSGLLMLPCSLRDGATLHYIDALYTSTSAVCVTGLIAADAGDTFSLFGQIVLLLLIQVGGLGVTAIGAGVILLMGRKMNLRGRNLVQEASNLESGHGVVRFVRSVFLTTLIIELCGAVLSFITFIQHYPAPRAVWLSLFHSVAAFNNSGFDVFGGGQSLIPYQHDVLLNLTTCALIFFGGIGFLVIREMVAKRWHWKRYSMHARVVLSVSAVLTVGGTLLIKLAARKHHVAGRVLCQCDRTHRRILHLLLRRFLQRRTAGHDGADVHRCFVRLNRRRYQNQHLLRPADGRTRSGIRAEREGFPLRHP